MPLRTKLHTHIFADNEHWSWQKFAVKRDKSVQFMKKRKEKKERRRSEATSGPRAFVSGHFYSMTYHAPSVCNDTAGRCFTLCQKCTRSFFFFFLFNRAAVTGRARLGSLSQHAPALIVSEQRAAPDNETRTPTSWPCCLIIQRWMEIKDLTHTLFIMWETCHSCQCRRGGGGGGSILICFTLLSSPCPRVSGSFIFFFPLGIGWVTKKKKNFAKDLQ